MTVDMMTIRAILIAGLIAVVPVTDAAAQSRGRDRDPDPREQSRGYPGQGLRDDDGGRGQPRASASEVVRRVQAGRQGRMLGVSSRGSDYVVRWEYPGGRVSDIRVDGQTGRVSGEN